MNKKIKITLIISILFSSFLITPVFGQELENKLSPNQNSDWKIIIAIGLINVNSQKKEINGFVVIGYNAGETITLQTINIKYDGIPFVITKSLFYIFCIYKEADENII
jgi:hypothetical protein